MDSDALDAQVYKWGQMSLLILMPLAILVREKCGKSFQESPVQRFLVSIIAVKNSIDLFGKNEPSSKNYDEQALSPKDFPYPLSSWPDEKVVKQRD